jgi:uncharacterized protein (TIGR00251 family)
MNLPYKRTKHGITLEVKVEPRSSQRCVAGVMDNHIIKVKLTAPPVEGSANEQLIEVIAEELGVKKSQVSVIRGHSSKRKVVEVRGIDPV